MDKLDRKKVCIMLLALVASLTLWEVLTPLPATVNVSAVRQIDCDKWEGSGFLTGDDTMVTALHVAEGTNCKDKATGSPLKLDKKDEKHDIATMKGTLPKDLPYIKISCNAMETNTPYLAYGISKWGQSTSITRMNALVATPAYTGETFELQNLNGTTSKSPGMRQLLGNIAPGMSGGPVVDLNGKAHALVNAGNPFYTYVYEFKNSILC